MARACHALLGVAVVACLVAYGHARPASPTPVGDQIATVRGLIARILPESQEGFTFTIVASTSGKDSYSIVASNGNVYINGSSGVALSAGLYRYLKDACGAIVRWGEHGSGLQVNVPKVWPDFAYIEVTSVYDFHYSWNVCTYGYTAPFWNWTRWEQEIDWLALRGVNFPLGFNGQEYVWRMAFLKLGFTDEDLVPWFTGPAYLVWNRMGNMRGWGGPLSLSWMTEQFNMQKLMLARMRNFGMLPILPCFSGHVPYAIKRIYPNASVTASPGDWGQLPPQYCCDYLLDPEDPLFQKFADVFMQIQTELFGTDHFYNCDTFNEMDPPSSNAGYLAKASKAVVEGIQKTDPDGTWVMQGYLFHHKFWTQQTVSAYLGGVGEKDMIILDLDSENSPLAFQFNNFYGKRWIWNLLHNYGGVRSLYGDLHRYTNHIVVDFGLSNGTNVGLGFTPEATEQNPVVYELLGDMYWRSQPFDIPTWLANYVSQSYNLPLGSTTPAHKAWLDNLLPVAYSTVNMFVSDLIFQPQEGACPNTAARRAARQKKQAEAKVGGGQAGNPIFWDAWRLMRDHSLTVGTTGNFEYDYVDVIRQNLDNLWAELFTLYCDEWSANQQDASVPMAGFDSLSRTLQAILTDMDNVLLTNPSMLLGVWLERAYEKANGTEEAVLFNLNARNQVSLWGPTGGNNGYAAKQWQGLVGDLYWSRWQYFYQTLHNSAISRKGVNWNDLGNQEFTMTWNWNSNMLPNYPTLPSGNITELGAQLYDQYTSALDDYEILPDTDDGSNNVVGQLDIGFIGNVGMAIACSSDPLCLGFNTNGWVKRQVNDTIIVPGVMLFVKKNDAFPKAFLGRRLK